MSEGSGAEATGESGEQATCSPLRRTVDLFVFAPVGVALSVAEDLPGLIAKGRKRVELHLGNARVVGRFVVGKGQRTLSEHLGARRDRGPDGAEAAGDDEAPVADGSPAAPRAPDPADGAVLAGALADYDTLSASQVVRRLESLGPGELRAVQRYEASTRNRRTILNRAGQLLAEHTAGQPTEPAVDAGRPGGAEAWGGSGPVGAPGGARAAGDAGDAGAAGGSDAEGGTDPVRTTEHEANGAGTPGAAG